MNKIKKISALVLCFLVLLGCLNLNTIVAAAKEVTYASSANTPNSLSTVYVSGSASKDASGEDENNPTSDFNKALSLVSKGGEILVIGDITVDDTTFLDKFFFLNGKKDGDSSRKKITFRGEANFNSMIYVNDLDFEFVSPNKDCVFLNGGYLEMRNSAILGNPNIYLGSKNEDVPFGENANLKIDNDIEILNEISNIYLGGYNGHTIDVSYLELKNVKINGIIDAKNVVSRSNVDVLGNTVVPSIINVSKIVIFNDADLYITDKIIGTKEIYADRSTITLNEKSKIEADYIYGDAKINFYENRFSLGNLITCKNIVGDLSISKDLINDGYSLNKIRSGNNLYFALLNNDFKTNYAPTIKHSENMVLREGTTVDLKDGVSAWDYEDGDVTSSIIYPDVDLTDFTVGKHEIIYQVSDKDGNITKSKQVIHIIENAYPIFKGVKDIEIKVKDVQSFDLLSGITVKDNKDENLTIKVDGKLSKPAPDTKEDFIITYTVQDSDNYVTSAKRTITVTNYMPKIKGLDDVVINKGEKFDFMQDVSASDYEDGIITNISIDKNIDTNIPGSYNLTYFVTDSDSNTTKSVRKVIIKGNSDWVEIGPSKPVEQETNPAPTPNPTPTPESKPEQIEKPQNSNQNEQSNTNGQLNSVKPEKPASKQPLNNDAKPVSKPIDNVNTLSNKENGSEVDELTENIKDETSNSEEKETNKAIENDADNTDVDDAKENKNNKVLISVIATLCGIAIVLIVVLKIRKLK